MADWRLTVDFIDENEGTTRKSYEGVFVDYAAASAAATALITDITALTTAGIVKYELTEVTLLNNIGAAGSNVFSRISANLKVAAGGSVNHTFPSPDAAVLSGNTLLYNQTPANLWDDYVENFTQASATWSLSDGEFIVNTDPTTRGKRIFVRSGDTNLR